MLALLTVTDVRDGRDHLVTDHELTAAAGPDGTRQALCGARIVPAPLVCPPSGRCAMCAALVAPPPASRPRIAWWRRLVRMALTHRS